MSDKEIIAAQNDEIERLIGDLARMHRIRRECAALCDDLADVLTMIGTDPMQHPEVERVLARHREARAHA